MSFEKAREIASNNIGSVMTRDVGGYFIVRDKSGNTLYAENTADATCQLMSNVQSIQELQSSIDEYRLKQRDSNKTIKLLKSEVNDLKANLSRIDTSDWKIINERERNEKERLLAERQVIFCQCEGSNENCAFCYGKGTYEVDGYGTKVK